MIPDTGVMTAGIILFLFTGADVYRHRKTEMLKITKKRKAVTFVMFILSIAAVTAAVWSMRADGDTLPGAKKLLSTTLKQRDVEYISGKRLTESLSDDNDGIKNGRTIQYTDSLYNRAEVSPDKILEITEDSNVPDGSVRIDKCLARVKTGIMYRYAIKYRIVMPPSP